MDVILTICSANFLAYAAVLGNSIAKTNPSYRFVIGLVDRLPDEINVAEWLPYEVIPVEILGIPEFPAMAERYDIVELNTAVKPFFLEYLYNRNPAAGTVTYLDPDMLVLGSFNALHEKLRINNIVLTPHGCSYDNSALNLRCEFAMLGTGVYNLGFVATARSETTLAFLKWWQKRLVDHCYRSGRFAVFVDQLWVALAPLYFEGVYVEKDPGYNMCHWNFFERSLSHECGRYVVNSRHDLIFYHFSGYDPRKPDYISTRVPHLLADHPELRPLFDEYAAELLANRYLESSSLPYSYEQKKSVQENEGTLKKERTLKDAFKVVCERTLRILPMALRRFLHRIAHFIAQNTAEP